MIGGALVPVLLVWSCAAVIALGIHLAVSLGDAGRLIISALRASAPAMWLVPAVLLVSEGTLTTSTLGLLLVANTARLLVSNLAPQNIEPRQFVSDNQEARRDLPSVPGTSWLLPDANSSSDTRRASAASRHSRNLAGIPAACGFAGCGAGIWTAAWIARDAYRPPKPAHALYSPVSIVLTLMLTTSLSIRENGPAPAVSKEPVTQLVNPRTAIQLPVKDLVPGVILRPEAKARQEASRLSLSILPSHSIQGPRTFSFTGEYHLFPRSSGRVQSDSVVYRGTPLDAAYINMGGSAMETEAYQPFDPPIDCSHCGKVQLALLSGERSPASATLRLVFGGGEDGGEADLGHKSSASSRSLRKPSSTKCRS